jgi:hypothetical protein
LLENTGWNLGGRTEPDHPNQRYLLIDKIVVEKREII